MRTSILAAGLLAAALMSSTAIAQTAAPVKDTKANEQTLSGAHWRSSKLIGVNVRCQQNEDGRHQ